MPEGIMLIESVWIPAGKRFQLALNKTFCPNPQHLTHRQVKQHQRTKINKSVLFASLPPPLIGFQRKVYSIRIEMQISILF